MASWIRRTHELCNLAYVHREWMIPAGFLRYGFVVFTSLAETFLFIPLTQNLKKYINEAQHRKGLDGTLKMRNFFIATFYFWLKKIFRVWARVGGSTEITCNDYSLWSTEKLLRLRQTPRQQLCLSNSSHDWTCERQKSRRLFTQF